MYYFQNNRTIGKIKTRLRVFKVMVWQFYIVTIHSRALFGSLEMKKGKKQNKEKSKSLKTTVRQEDALMDHQAEHLEI